VVVGPVDAAGLDDDDRRPAGDPVLGDLVGERLGALVLAREVAVAAEALLDDLAVGVPEDRAGRDATFDSNIAACSDFGTPTL